MVERNVQRKDSTNRNVLYSKVAIITISGRGTSASRSGGLFGGLRKTGGGSFSSLSESRARGAVSSPAKGVSGHPSGYPRDSRWGVHEGGSIGRAGTDRWGGSRRTSWGRSRGGGLFTKSNIGSFIAGAAAGYLTYKAGKALIRSAYAPMMWNNRPYYWGSNYYRGGYGTHMCRMPIDGDDPQLGNVYFEDGKKPKELVWSCNYDEYCCGYDCCWRGVASPYWNRKLSRDSKVNHI
ncbi:Uncharacterized protein ACO02O_06752 [Dirofilaria immitis]